jgi:hypothetical protein
MTVVWPARAGRDRRAADALRREIQAMTIPRSSITLPRLLLTGLAVLLVALAGCGSDAEQSAQGPAAVVSGDGTAPARGSLDAASLAGVQQRLEAKGFTVEDGSPTAQATRAITVTDAPGVDISAYLDRAAARAAYVAARRLAALRPGRVLVRLRAAGTRLYYADSGAPLSRHERDVFRAVVAAGEGAG